MRLSSVSGFAGSYSAAPALIANLHAGVDEEYSQTESRKARKSNE
jgi:hypothetical protein